jgi:hypothetical protein
MVVRGERHVPPALHAEKMPVTTEAEAAWRPQLVWMWLEMNLRRGFELRYAHNVAHYLYYHLQQDRQCTHTATLWRVGVTSVPLRPS